MIRLFRNRDIKQRIKRRRMDAERVSRLYDSAVARGDKVAQGCCYVVLRHHTTRMLELESML